jgi:hypothetical protein
MDVVGVIAIAVIIVCLVLIIGVVWQRKRRSDHLQERFGPEYRETVAEVGSRHKAEAELTEREKRRATLDIRPLGSDARRRYAAAWTTAQADFVDDPHEAVGSADRLVLEVLQERGYPMDDFDQRAADISVDHPGVVSNYRAAHDISRRSDAGEASTEDLRQAMVHYRALFDELLVPETADTHR